MEHESIPAIATGLHSFPGLIRQLGESFLIRDVMIPRDKIAYVEPGDLPAAKKIVAHRNFSVVPCSVSGREFPAVFETIRPAASERFVVEERGTSIGDFIPDTTPLAEALAFFQAREWYLTLRGNGVAGLMTYWEFNSHEFHVQLYAALSQLEEISRNALAHDGCGVHDSHGLLLSPDVLEKVRDRFEASRKDLGGNRFVDELEFHHVQEALKKHSPWRKFLHERIGKSLSSRAYDRLYRFTDVRDAVMHGRVLFPTYRHFRSDVVQVGQIVDLIGHIRAYCPA